MECTRLKKVFISSLLSGSVLLSVGITANANDLYAEKYQSEIYQEKVNLNRNYNHQNQEEKLVYLLDELVKDGSLEEERAEAIKVYLQNNKLRSGQENDNNRDEYRKTNIIYKLQKDNIITEEEAKLIIEKVKSLREQELDTALNFLTERNIITEAKAKEVKSYLAKVNEERKTEFQKVKDMTKEERIEYFKKTKRERKNIFSRMVEEGVLTKEQSKELKKTLKNTR